MTDKIKRRITIELEGNEEGDINMALGEVMRLLKEGFTSGFDSNDTGCFKFDTSDTSES